jgi:uncharacterized protein GlcG (DUF336 family)
MSVFNRKSRRVTAKRQLSFERLETRTLLSLPAAAPDPAGIATAAEVDQLLRRAVAASSRTDAIIAVVDRNGTILGVDVEPGVHLSNPNDLDFAIDGAVAEARTAAFFSNNGNPTAKSPTSPTALTSRTIREISQTTITQREVQSNPDPSETDPTKQGPGLVAPIGLGGHFPPDISHTPPVDLFGIEQSNRAIPTPVGGLIPTPTSTINPDGSESIDTSNITPYNVNSMYLADDGMGGKVQIPVALSYGQQSGTLPNADTSRGIGTLPGGIPLFKNKVLVGGIGVFFPGTNGYADFEQNFQFNNKKQTALQRTNAPLELLAEWMAFAAVGGSAGVNARVGVLGGVSPVPGYDFPLDPNNKISLVGITLDQVGAGSAGGVKQTLKTGQTAGRQTAPPPGFGGNVPVLPGQVPGMETLTGKMVPNGVLVTPHDGDGLTAAQVTQIINQAIVQAGKVRAAIRLPLSSTARMLIAVADKDGNLLGLYRMTDATVFSIDVAVAKSRNVAYYASANLQAFDRVPVNDVKGQPYTPPYNSPYLPIGTAFTNRTFRFLAEPRYPSGVDGSVAGAFSILREDWVDPATGYNKTATPAPISDIHTVLGYDAFHPGTNFHDPNDQSNQNGVIFFPGSSPLYVLGILSGGLGISGDGVDQDDVVTASGALNFAAALNIRADQFFVRGVRLPYQKFDRNALGL